MKQHLYGHK